MNRKKAILILGYNNVRLNDIKKIKNRALEHFHAATILCKQYVTPEDLAASDYVIDTSLEVDGDNVHTVLRFIADNHLHVIAVLPFSDKGTQLGAVLAHKLSLRGPRVRNVKAALDKYVFRKAEQKAQHMPNFYRSIQSIKIDSLEALCHAYNAMHGQVFVKPSNEGNSRGCMLLTNEADLPEAWQAIKPYVDQGVVAESLIPNGMEYSWDHVNGYAWITEKKTTQGKYKAEIQQIVPAPIDRSMQALLTKAGEFMANLSGSNNCACHNEVMFVQASNEIFGIEPNLRPAGMSIWDLASLSFDRFDPWLEWIVWATGRTPYKKKTNHKAKIFSGIRMLKANRDGAIESMPASIQHGLVTNTVTWVDLVWTKKVGDRVKQTVNDNADFIGYVILKAPSYTELSGALVTLCNYLEQEVVIATPR
jgi:biotin carboxylase